MLGRSHRSWSRDQPLGPTRLVWRQLPKALSASSRAAIPAPGTAAGSLRVPRRTLQTRPALPPAPKDPDALAAPGLQDREWDAASNPSCPKFLPGEPRSLLQVVSAGRAAARPVRGGAGAPVARGVRREEQERAASALPFPKRRHARRAPRFLGLWRESRAGGRRPGTTQVSPARARPGAAAGAAGLAVPAPGPLGVPSAPTPDRAPRAPSPAPSPPPARPRGAAALSQARRRPPARHPQPFPAPSPRKMEPDQPKRGRQESGRTER